MIKKVILFITFISLFFVVGTSLSANIDLSYFDYSAEGDYCIVYSNISSKFNHYITVASDAYFERIIQAFDIEPEVLQEEKDIIIVFENEEKFNKFGETLDKARIADFMNSSKAKKFNPAPNNVYGFNAIFPRVKKKDVDVVFYVPNISTDPPEDIYNYSPLFQGLAEQFLKNYINPDLPEWFYDSIISASSDYRKDFRFSLFYRIETYKCFVYEREFWSRLVLFDRYWNTSEFTLEDVLNDEPAIKSNELYIPYVSLLTHYLMFKDFRTDLKFNRTNFNKRLKEVIKDKDKLSAFNLKKIIDEEYVGGVDELQKDLKRYFSQNSKNRQIRAFLDMHKSAKKEISSSGMTIYTTEEFSPPAGKELGDLDKSDPSNPFRVFSGDKLNYYESARNFEKGEAFIIDLKAVPQFKTIYLHFDNFAVDDTNRIGSGHLPVKGRVITSQDGRNWFTWERINSNMPVVYKHQRDHVFLRYWGVVTDLDMNSPLTINEMWIH